MFLAIAAIAVCVAMQTVYGVPEITITSEGIVGITVLGAASAAGFLARQLKP